ncbi:lysine--tRNA ligase [Saccharopolyspora erythraea]|uniref:Lysine--tRNA ligase n=1 Tax=Saccharopolyspora erythraea (strain ATCC 11635 / DSM 40517 / JCM 4748 / NBRC 13426 / NCIMB 8594 / NRRL 2338) TaxID=405948 RepID=A4F6T3_SACEN|nr:lysine--tRNA ligase [Saccharopolyspora erythraea]EQD87288.1 lysyl-tRNA synthetase [Saccharopolyspora erythraea D]QRK90411.1 lysine--tRNA ligase [Saccharopolyspora erythraea]CAL99757.1 lysyl-tRNA synthetase class II [Saccharopolyspora erythraea NRRL 2338]
MTDQDRSIPTAADAEGVDDLPEQLRVRREKRERMLAGGVDPYPVNLPITHTLAEVRAAHPDLAPDTYTGDQVGVAGRVMFLRNTGKLCFATLRGGDGTELQAMLSLKQVGEDALASWKSDVDLGDHVFVHGEVITSRRGELSVMADEWRLAAKTLRPLPVAHKELGDETRVRQRYVDLIVRKQAADTVRTRATVQRSLRDSFQRRGFIEVETPMLQTLHGGAAARPFVTHSNAFDMELYLRIAPELYLKRCVVGGIEKVFEINRNFRNEGSDSSHSPEFAMLEFYQAYSDYDGMARLTRQLVQEAAEALTGSQVVTWFDGTEYDLSGEWSSVTMYGSLSEALDSEITPETPVEVLRKHADSVGLQTDPAHGHGKLVEELWEHLVGDHLYAPTFVRDFPLETAPLTRQHRSEPGVAEKWDLYTRGFELATGYSELVDPVVERARLEEQARLAASGDEEAMHVDEDFLRALEYGMPPSGGVGMGIDRLLMALTGLGIRETILFPLVRPE